MDFSNLAIAIDALLSQELPQWHTTLEYFLIVSIVFCGQRPTIGRNVWLLA